jgi:hypothetical protein
MKNTVVKVLFIVLGFVTQAQANPWWWWPGKASQAPVKTVQFSLPTNNGGIVSVTVPARGSTPVKPGAGRGRKAQDSTTNRREDERIAADLERHF